MKSFHLSLEGKHTYWGFSALRANPDMKVFHICTFQLIPWGNQHTVTLPPPTVTNVNGVIYLWTLTCKQSDYVWCKEGLLCQHRATCCDFSQAHYVFSMQKSSLAACCLFCLSSYQNDANVWQKCDVMKIQISWLSVILFSLFFPRWYRCIALSVSFPHRRRLYILNIQMCKPNKVSTKM